MVKFLILIFTMWTIPLSFWFPADVDTGIVKPYNITRWIVTSDHFSIFWLVTDTVQMLLILLTAFISHF